MVLHQHRAPGAERRRDAVALVVVDDQVRVAEPRDAVREQDPVVGQHLEVGRRRAERGRVRRMAVDDRADVRPGAVDAGVEDGLEVQDGVRVVERDDVLRLDLVERDALALDPDLAVRTARADVPERQVGVALRGEDAARPGDLLAKALGDRDHSAAVSVGGILRVREAEDHDHVLVARCSRRRARRRPGCGPRRPS